MAAGLKDALSQGLFRGFNAFADPNGNPLVRFAFPGDAAKIEKTLQDIGMDKMVNQVTGKIYPGYVIRLLLPPNPFF